jgi:hypothetical protein
MLRLICILLLILPQAGHADWSGNISTEVRTFTHPGRLPEQESHGYSLSAEPEYSMALADSRDRFVFTPFLRLDSQDDERTHADIRELYWHKVEQNWELTAGINKIFWGVTETIHLVDIINQTDTVENIDGEDKLGQPMLQFAWINNWGLLDIFVLPGFRERTFAGRDGRPQLTPLPIDTDRALYEADEKERHIDYALRWSGTYGIWDVGLSQFDGTGREPEFIPDFSTPVAPVLLPYYGQIRQTGLDVQATLDAWLLKLEAIHRRGNNASFNALAAGFEYTFVGVFDSAADIGLVSEYLYDQRDSQPFDNDLATGLRLTLNDTSSTEMLLAILSDLERSTRSYFIEASRRLDDSWKLNFELRGASDVADDDPLRLLQREQYMQLDLAYYF